MRSEWIEIHQLSSTEPILEVLLPRGASGLKLLGGKVWPSEHMSSPMRGRGLKSLREQSRSHADCVAPHAGAWMEVLRAAPTCCGGLSHPRAGDCTCGGEIGSGLVLGQVHVPIPPGRPAASAPPSPPRRPPFPVNATTASTAARSSHQF